MHPELHKSLGHEDRVLPHGDFEPENRAVAYRTIMALPNDYPHCTVCRRAMLFADNAFSCPNGHMRVDQPTKLNWWQRVFVVREA